MNESDLYVAKAIVESQKEENLGEPISSGPGKTVISKVHEKIKTFR